MFSAIPLVEVKYLIVRVFPEMKFDRIGWKMARIRSDCLFFTKAVHQSLHRIKNHCGSESWRNLDFFSRVEILKKEVKIELKNQKTEKLQALFIRKILFQKRLF